MNVKVVDPPKPTVKIAPGDILKVVLHVKVADVSRINNHSILVEDLDYGLGRLELQGKALLESVESAQYWETEKFVTQTELARLMEEEVKSHPFSTKYIKKEGDERVLSGRRWSSDYQGRSQVDDLNEPAGKRQRQVDNRTILWLIFNKIKYILKK